MKKLYFGGPILTMDKRNPTAVEPMAIKDIRILATIKEDAVLYTAER
ncbi:MAG: hypothetical protein J6Q54_03810 [Oscillospiraceae bacterium]|nr:hypothetical protein [Oscillospiraceae bacterium]